MTKCALFSFKITVGANLLKKVKGRKFQNEIVVFSIFQKNNENVSLISTLATKKWSNKRNEGTLNVRQSRKQIITSVSKKLGQNAVVIHYCALFQFFETDVMIKQFK